MENLGWSTQWLGPSFKWEMESMGWGEKVEDLG